MAVDFDGVVVDALHECAAVTYFADQVPDPDQAPGLDSALRQLPASFLARFTAVRPYCRTLADFMVANQVDDLVHTRAQFEQARRGAMAGLLDQQADTGERLRSRWRRCEPTRWLASHQIQHRVVDALRQWDGHRWIVSAKDGDSIRAILQHHEARHFVDIIVGSCDSKIAALQKAATRGSVLFIDDNLDHVLAARNTSGVTARWATWGYAAPDDDGRARAAGIQPLDQHELTQLICLSEGTHP